MDRFLAWLFGPIIELIARNDQSIRSSLARIISALDRLTPLTTFQVYEPTTGLTLEGANLLMNLKNTQQVNVQIKPKNRKGGPASGVSGSYAAVAETGAFTVEQDPSNPLRATVKANPESPGGDADVGIVRFEGTRTASDGTSQPVVAELAINVTPADAEIIEIEAGEATEQD